MHAFLYMHVKFKQFLILVDDIDGKPMKTGKSPKVFLNLSSKIDDQLDLFFVRFGVLSLSRSKMSGFMNEFIGKKSNIVTQRLKVNCVRDLHKVYH